MCKMHEKLLDKLIQTHQEVGEVDPTDISDYCDNLFW